MRRFGGFMSRWAMLMALGCAAPEELTPPHDAGTPCERCFDACAGWHTTPDALKCLDDCFATCRRDAAPSAAP